MDYLQPASAAQPAHTVSLRIPEKLSFQLVFRQERELPLQVKPASGLSFHFIDSVPASLAKWSALKGLLGLAGALKALAKVQRGRIFYFVADEAQVLHTGWVSSSFCRFYRVEPGDVVIGPIWSAEASRSRGVGAYGTQMAINALLEKGVRVFFIDTANSNVPCLKMIDKCGFGAPVASYLRD